LLIWALSHLASHGFARAPIAIGLPNGAIMAAVPFLTRPYLVQALLFIHALATHWMA
jgi:hypothetical protein